METPQRLYILSEIAKLTGRRIPASYIQKTSLYDPQIDRFHTLISGIYKPKWSDLALSIVSKIKSPYDKKDEVVWLEDGRWLMTYSPRIGGLKHSDNQSLIQCMKERAPIGVFKQETEKTHPEYGSTYRVLGLGIVTEYDGGSDVFIIEGVDHETLDRFTGDMQDEEQRIELLLYAQLTNKFNPFVTEEKSIYKITSEKRDIVFRRLLLKEYDYTCSVCNMKFLLDNIAEATAAHIIPKHAHGTDDPRNGLTLCRTHHWAFDQGIFTISHDYRILLSPQLKKAETKNFGLIEMNGEKIILPQNEVIYPDKEALDWHKKKVWLK